jgi:hypothetical protein
MNTKILELANQADVVIHGIFGKPMNVYELERFAELIVAEATKALWTEECMTSDLALAEYSRNSNKIKQHFGIAE